MLNFCSALYLAWRHPSHALPGWDELTLGEPAALRELPAARRLARGLAQWQGLPGASLCSSTLHLFWDLFGLLAGKNCVLLVDKACYPVLGWGVQRAQAMGVPLAYFSAHDLAHLENLLRACHARDLRAVIVSEGYFPAQARFSPLPQYVQLARRYGGQVWLDDTQAMGWFGADPDPHQPWGYGGGGSLRYFGLESAPCLVGASLAKGLGAPLAVLAGPRQALLEFEQRAATRLHSSPPNAASLAAANLALQQNQSTGESRRRHVGALLHQWRHGIRAAGLRTEGGWFPQQNLCGPYDWRDLHRFLLRRGVRALLRSSGPKPGLSFILNADHDPDQIAFVLRQIRSWRRQTHTPAFEDLEEVCMQ